MHVVPRDRASVLEAIYGLPVRLRLRGGVTLLQLVRETGYPALRAEISVAELRSGLAGRAGIVAEWLAYSRDKAEDWGWFFQGPYQGLYLTGSRTRTLEGPLNTREADEACAHFIKAELEAILGHDVRPGTVPPHPVD